jgi:ribonuclease T
MNFNQLQSAPLHKRFRGFLPVVVDIETGGVDPNKSAVLEVCIVLLTIDEQGFYHRAETHFEHILPFEGGELDPRSLAFNHIDPFQPLRFAVDETTALKNLFKPIHAALKKSRCQRAVLVGHNAWFDLLFLKQACRRTEITMPFHRFTCFDTATLGGLLYGETVLAKVVHASGLSFNADEAHSAVYDAEITADLFCKMLNQWHKLATAELEKK